MYSVLPSLKAMKCTSFKLPISCKVPIRATCGIDLLPVAVCRREGNQEGIKKGRESRRSEYVFDYGPKFENVGQLFGGDNTLKCYFKFEAHFPSK